MHVRRLCKLQCTMFYALSKLFLLRQLANLTPSWRSRLARSSDVYHVTTPAKMSMQRPGPHPRCASANGSGA